MKLAMMVVSVVFFLFSCIVEAASFSCQTRLSSIEKRICKSTTLSKLDKDMAVYYSRAVHIKGFRDIKKEQILWLAERDKCGTDACIEGAYNKRIKGIDLFISAENTCRRIKNIYATGIGDKYSVPLSDVAKRSSEISYSLDVDGDGKADSLFGVCGNGYGSICDFEMRLADGKLIKFISGSDVRLINLDHRFYVVNGVSDAGGEASFTEGFLISELTPSGLMEICEGGKGVGVI